MVVVVSSLSAQQPKSSAAVPPGVPAPGAADAATIAEVMAFEKQCDDAAVKGDVAFLERALSSDFVMTHGNGWTSGGAPLKVTPKPPGSPGSASSRCRTSTAISTQSRWSCMATSRSPSGDTALAADDRAESWQQPLYVVRAGLRRRGGQWQFLSHRTVKGPVGKRRRRGE